MGRRQLLRDSVGHSGNGESESERGVALHYIGNGDALIGIPARDIAAGHSFDTKLLLDSGLYETVLEIPDDADVVIEATQHESEGE